MLDSLILATAVMASQEGYTAPPPPPPIPNSVRRETTSEAPAPPTPAPQPIVPAVPGKTLSDLPNVTIRYFDVAGKNLKAINKSIERIQKPDSAGRMAIAPTAWALDMKFNKNTANGQCKITAAKATFSATVALPRLVAHAAHKPDLTAAWRAHLAGIENSQAANLWFVYDRLRNVENAVLASSCEGAQAAGTAAIERLRAQAAEFQRSNAAVAQAAQ